MTEVYVPDGKKYAIWNDVQGNPVGTGPGENFTVPLNYVIPPARIYVVNHSLTHKWKRVVEAVSYYRGAEDILMKNKAMREMYNIESFYKKVASGRDMNVYANEAHPVNYAITIGGQKIIVQPARHSDTPPPRYEVPDGAWDIYLGNYERMRSEDNQIKSTEKTKFANSWCRRNNPVWKFSDDGVETDYQNPYGFLEFIRVSMKAVEVPLDKEYLSAIDFVEA
jgi:hypothetical protein